jgi:hypothetical protein
MLAQVTRELTGAVNDIRDLSQRAAAGSVQQGAAVSEIDSLLARLQSLRSTVVATHNEEKRCLARLDSRLQHLAAAPDRYSSCVLAETHDCILKRRALHFFALLVFAGIAGVSTVRKLAPIAHTYIISISVLPWLPCCVHCSVTSPLTAARAPETAAAAVAIAGSTNGSANGNSNGNDWEVTRLDRWIADYLLQSGYHTAAKHLTSEVKFLCDCLFNTPL